MRWRVCSIGSFVDSGLAHIQTGPFGTQLRASDYVNEGVPVINVRNIGFGDLRPEKVEYVNTETADRLSAHLLAENDIVFGRKGAVERHVFVTSDQQNWMQGSDCIRLRFVGGELDPRFVSYALLRSEHQQWMLLQAGNKATMASLNQDVIRRILLPVPPFHVQKRIAGVLSAYDDLIENNRRRTALLEQSARQLYREWFVRLRFPGYEHTRIVDGVPDGWERVSFETALVLQRGFDLPLQDRNDGNVPVCGSTGIDGYHNVPKVAGPGVVTGRSGSLGTVYYVRRAYWPLNTALWVKEFRRITPAFALFLMQGMDLKQYNGGASVPTLDRKAVHRVMIVLPSPKLISAFDEFAEPTFNLISKLDEQNQKLRAARDLLLPKLMSGELAV